MPRISKKPNLKVLDLSHHNTVVSFQKLYDSGIRGVILKSTQGTSYVDPTYETRVKQARAAGLLTGAYHFATGDSVDAQIKHFLDVVEVDDKTLVALDYEPNRLSQMSFAQAKDFLQKIEKTIGRKAVLYSGNQIKEQMTKPDAYVNSHRLWLAQYGSSYTTPPGWNDCWLWQYSETGSAPGVTGGIDSNSYDETDEQLAKEWSGAPTVTVVIPAPTVQPNPVIVINVDPVPQVTPAPISWWSKIISRF